MPSQTKTTTEASPPKLMPESQAGYAQAQQFFQNQLAQPSVYPRQRFAPETELQSDAYKQGLSTFGNEAGAPGYRQGAEAEMGKTLRGEWMGGPEQQAAVKSAAAPIFERFENQTMPGIRDRSQFSGQGATSGRRGIAEQNATQDLGQSLATGVVAPIYAGERERMTRQGIEGSQGLLAQDIARIGGMQELGENERNLQNMPLQADRDVFEETIGRQATSAGDLFAASGMGGGKTIGYYDPSPMRMALGAGKA